MSEALICRCGCGREATWLGTGQDIDGTEFSDEPMCESAASYCEDASGELRLRFAARPLVTNEAAFPPPADATGTEEPPWPTEPETEEAA